MAKISNDIGLFHTIVEFIFSYQLEVIEQIRAALLKSKTEAELGPEMAALLKMHH